MDSKIEKLRHNDRGWNGAEDRAIDSVLLEIACLQEMIDNSGMNERLLVAEEAARSVKQSSSSVGASHPPDPNEDDDDAPTAPPPNAPNVPTSPNGPQHAT